MTTLVTKKRCGFLATTNSGVTQTACKVVASWRVGVALIDKHKTEEVLVWLPRMIVCNRHRLQLKLEDVVTDAGWKRMAASVVAQGHQKPKRGLSRLVFQHLRMDLR